MLFRDAESDIRKKMIEGDYVDAVIGLGKNLFYNSSMESCLLVCRMKKPKERKGKIVFINAVNEVRMERSSAWLEKDHIKKIANAYRSFKDNDSFAKVATINQALENNGNLSIPLYVKVANETQSESMKGTLKEIKQTHEAINSSMENLFEKLENLGIEKWQKTLSNGLTSEKPIFGNLLSEKNCTPYLFSDVSDCIEQHDKTPLENGLTRFIGLENIEPENFTLQSFGNIEDGTTFTKRFSKGDVLFGKRRAYLKKVAVADFDGICSSDILVFRAKANMMLPELLPYYASSDAFMNHAVSTSAGSLSPRTKWRDLASFELSIPDLEIQEKIMDVFNQLRESLTLIKNQTQTLKTLKQKLLNEILGG